MKLYDISKGVFEAGIFPGDPKPVEEQVRSIANGDDYNLSALYSGMHAGTHVDAPLHFFEDADSVDRLNPAVFLGRCQVVGAEGLLTGEDIEQMLQKGIRRLLIRGEGTAFLSQSAAFVLCDEGVVLVGTDAQSIADETGLLSVHKQLLGDGVAILENLRLTGVPDGQYFLFAPPVKVEGVEAAPCRAVLIEGL